MGITEGQAPVERKCEWYEYAEMDLDSGRKTTD